MDIYNEQANINIEDILEDILNVTTLSDLEKDNISNKILTSLKLVKDKKGLEKEIETIKHSVDIQDIDIEEDDVIEYLNGCWSGTRERILKKHGYKEEDYEDFDLKINYKTLEDEYKGQIVSELFEKYSWLELEEIKKCYEKRNS